MAWDSWPSPPLLTWPQTAVIPLVNVTLLLAGLVMLSPTTQVPAGLPLQLPRAITAEAVGQAAVVLTITERQLLYLNGELVTMAELGTRLTPLLSGGRAVLIQTDRQVPMGIVAEIWDTCRRLGASRVAMATAAPAGH